MIWPDAVTLEGAHARLEPLSQGHRANLAEAVADGARPPELADGPAALTARPQQGARP